MTKETHDKFEKLHKKIKTIEKNIVGLIEEENEDVSLHETEMNWAVRLTTLQTSFLILMDINSLLNKNNKNKEDLKEALSYMEEAFSRDFSNMDDFDNILYDEIDNLADSFAKELEISI